MTQTEALKLALEALETCYAGDYSTGHVIDPSFDEDAVKEAIIAIKEALAQQCVCGEPDSAGAHRTDGPCLAPQPELCTYPNCDYPCMNLPDCKEPKQEQHKQYLVNSLPNEKTTDKWESTRVSDYNSGWNDCRKTMFISNTKPVLEIVNGQINRSWDAIPENFTGLLYTTPPQPKEPEQEHVEWGVDWGHDGNSVSIIKRLAGGGIEVVGWEYAPHPPQRTWEGLSVFEINDLVENTEYEDYQDLVERTEAKLKEKNT